jgi:uncharacterized protein (DUF1778 family)
MAAKTNPGNKYRILTVHLTIAQYKLIEKAAGGSEHVAEFITTAALNAAKQVKSEGV